MGYLHCSGSTAAAAGLMDRNFAVHKNGWRSCVLRFAVRGSHLPPYVWSLLYFVHVQLNL